MKVAQRHGAMTLVAHRGDAKTLLAFDLTTEAARDRLAGFTIQVSPPGGAAYYILNNLRFEHPGDHAQDPAEPAFSTLNAPIHKFRWAHVPGSVHQGLEPAYGPYRYAVTPRYFDARGALLPVDQALTATVDILVGPFVKDGLALGFTRGFVQSQAFVRHFGRDALIRPRDAALQFDTSAICGANAQGERFSYAQQYAWSGATARKLVFDLLDEVRADPALSIAMFAYDLNEPDLIGLLLALGRDGRATIILDDAALHHDAQGTKPEDQFESLFAAASGADRIKRGHFSRYAHDKVVIVSRGGVPFKVLTGSTNFSVTGLYVNANHVLVYTDAAVAKCYADVFQQVWDEDVHAAPFARAALATDAHAFDTTVPATSVTFSPHRQEDAGRILGAIVERIDAEAQVADGLGNVLFAVMEIATGKDDPDAARKNPVYTALNALHANDDVFSFGISDRPDGIALYPIGASTGVLVTAKPGATRLPPPFAQVPGIAGHEIHHKFVVCGFGGDDPVVYCGSSNLALGGEVANGDNLIAIRDADVVTVFAIEALLLVDHYNFLDGVASRAGKQTTSATALSQQAAVSAGWFLGTTDAWAHKFFDPHDLHAKDRQLFAR